jgi:hypothetical protein
MRGKEMRSLPAALLSVALILSVIVTFRPVDAQGLIGMDDHEMPYSIWFDVMGLYADSNLTHIMLMIRYNGSVPNSHDVELESWMCIDTDLDGVEDYVISLHIHGDGGGGSIELWDGAGWTVSPPGFHLLFDVGGDHLGVEFPLASIGLAPGSSFNIGCEGWSIFFDDVEGSFSYTIGGANNILLDGYSTDWGGASPSFSDAAGDLPYPEFDWTGFYTTDNSTWIFHRFDVRGSTTKTLGSGNAGIIRYVEVYYDTDQNSGTGYRVGDIGAEYMLGVEFELTPSGRWGGSELSRWNGTDWEVVGYFPAAWHDTFEWGLPISLIGVAQGGKVSIHVSASSSSGEGIRHNSNIVLDLVPDTAYATYTIPVTPPPEKAPVGGIIPPNNSLTIITYLLSLLALAFVIGGFTVLLRRMMNHYSQFLQA